jgi:hypothetical protein
MMAVEKRMALEAVVNGTLFRNAKNGRKDKEYF